MGRARRGRKALRRLLRRPGYKARLSGMPYCRRSEAGSRYFYKGTGSVRSRILYALATSVICKGDNGHWQAKLLRYRRWPGRGWDLKSLLSGSGSQRSGIDVESTLIGIGSTAAKTSTRICHSEIDATPLPITLRRTVRPDHQERCAHGEPSLLAWIFLRSSPSQSGDELTGLTGNSLRSIPRQPRSSSQTSLRSRGSVRREVHLGGRRGGGSLFAG